MLRRSERSYSSDAPLPAEDVAPAPTAAVPVSSMAPAAEQVPAGVPATRRLGGGGTIATVGLLTVLIGAWGGIVPFVGPLFGFGATGTPSWDWTLAHTLLWLVPGAVAVFMGLLMMTQAPGVSSGIARGAPWIIGFMAVLCGAWFAFGPILWPALESAHVPFVAAGPFHTALYWIGYSLGPGVILAMLGGCAMGISMLNRRAVPAATTSVVGPRRSGRVAA
jgi:hypothetical protein